MLALWAALAGQALHVERGWAPHYSPHLMAQVAANRDIAPVACMVSRPRGPIGGWVWIYGHVTGALLHCKVVDVSEAADLKRHERTGRITELSFEVTRALCGRTDERVVDCPVTVIELER